MATYTGSLIVKGGTFANAFEDWGGPIVISGGTFAKKPAAKHIAAESKVVENNGKYVVVPAEVDGVVTTPADLAAAIAQGGIVYVNSDLDLNNAWTSVKPVSELTIIGNGYTITNLNLPLLAGGVSSKVTVKGLTIADSNVGVAAFENGLGTGAIIPYVDAYGNVAIEDCHLVNTTVTGNKRAGGFIGYTSGQTVTIKNSSVEGCAITAVGGAGGLIGYSQSVVTVENTSVKNTKVTATEDRQGTEKALAGAVIGTVNGNTAFTNVTISNNTVSNNNALPAFDDCIGRKVSGTLTVDGHSFVSNGLYKGDAADYYVYNADGLAKINEMFKDYSLGAGAVIELMSDIDFTGKTWTQVDSHQDWKTYLKELNGNNHTISNFNISGQAMFSRFSGIGTVTIKDLTFDNATVNANGINASILTIQAYQNVLLDNVDVKNSQITGTYKVAPLIGSVYDEKATTVVATLKNCDVSNTTVTATQYDYFTTGMVAFVYKGDNDQIVFENCTVTDVTLVSPNNIYSYHAAIYCDDEATLHNEAEGVTVTNCNFRMN
jgi:hypothetical protein